MMPLLNLDNLYCTYYQTSLITQMIWLVKHTVVLSSHIFRWIEPPPQTSVKREDEEKRQKAREGVLCGQSECLIHVLDRGHDPWVHVLVWVTAITAKPLTWERNTHNASLWQSNVDILKKMLDTKLLRCCSGGLLAQKSPLSSSSQYPILNIWSSDMAQFVNLFDLLPVCLSSTLLLNQKHKESFMSGAQMHQDEFKL